MLKTDGTAWPANEDTEGTDKVPAKYLGQEVSDEADESEE